MDKFKLSAYKEIVECYEELYQFQYGENNNYEQDFGNLKKWHEKIQSLIDLEANMNIFPEDDFYSHLFVLRERISSIVESKNKLVNSICVPIPLKPDTQSSSAQKNDKDNDLRVIIRNTQVKPKIKGFQDIAGLSDIKKLLITMAVLPLTQPQLYVGRKICNSILLYGPPGTGKTQMAHALAAEISACLFSVTSSDILSKYIGENEKMVKALFSTVKETRFGSTVLFMDEIDGLCKRRDSNEPEWNRRLKTELMCQLTDFEDCSNIYLICATNCPWDLDPAFFRRFQQRIHVPLPVRVERYELFQLLIKNTTLDASPNHWKTILDQTEGYSGSDITNLVHYALTIPLLELTSVTMWEHFGDNMYRPATNDSNSESTVYRDLSQMPPGSIKARSANVDDLIKATQFIKRTVSVTDERKYWEFINKV